MNFPNLSTKLASEAWCIPPNTNKQMDVELAKAFAEILDAEMSKPNLGCATTGQLLDELRARVDTTYSTVFSEQEVKEPPIENLPTAQCSTGTTQSRLFPARAGKVMESASHT